jgi:ABC-type Zn uptake system ZnuABC Zn-binding protein ZnuA
MSKWFIALLAAALVTGLGLAPAAAQTERLQVVASFSILADVAANVAGDAADVRSLMPAGSDPHGYAPIPQDLVALAEADVVFVVGANFEETLFSTIANAADGMNIVTASSCVDILPFGGEAHDHAEGEMHDAEEAYAEHEAELAALCAAHHAELAALHGAETGPHADHTPIEPLGMLYTLACDHHGEEEAAGGEHTHEAGSCDPHVWTDPHNGMYWAMLIRDTLSAMDPANAGVYAANTAAYLAALDGLAHDELRPLLETVPEASRKLVTAHSAFGYFANAYGFTQVGVIIPGGSTLAEPSAAEIADLITVIREQGVPAIFAETTVSSTLTEQIAAEAGAQFTTLYSGTLSAPDGPAATYIDYLRYNARTIAAALGGSVSE